MALVKVIERDGEETFTYLDHEERIDTAMDEFTAGPFSPQEYITYLQSRAESENYHSLISAYDTIDEHLQSAGVSDDARSKFWHEMANGGGLL